MKQAFDRARQAGVLAVAAAGNESHNNDVSPECPCAHSNNNILCVAAADQAGGLADFSNYGVNTVDVAAPGVDIYSTLVGSTYGEPAPNAGLGDNSGNGTSFATPHVTGIAALMKAKNPTYNYLQLKENLILAAQPTSNGGLANKKGRIGTGFIGDTGQSSKTCASTGLSYTEMTVGGAAIGGIDLTTGRPFVFFSQPYTETSLSPVNLTGVKNLAISLAFGASGVTLFLSNSDNGATVLSPTTIPYPSPWNWTGTDKAAFVYYGVNGETGTNSLYVRSLVSVR